MDNIAVTGTTALTKAWTGTWTLSFNNTYTGQTTVSGGLLRLNTATALPGGVTTAGGTSALLFDGVAGTGGVIGLTAATGDFTRSIVGITPDVTDVGWAVAGWGGFAAFGGDRNVNFGGLGATIAWSSGGGVLGGGLILGHSTSDSTITVVNPINLNSAGRTVQVENGSATVDAILSGAITAAFDLTKTGAGILQLNNTGNAYDDTIIESGTVRLGAAGVLPNAGEVIIRRSTDAGSTSGVLDLNGFNETIDVLTLGSSTTTAANAGQTPSVVNTGGAAALTLGNNVTYNAGSVTFENGQATISANLTLSGNRTFTVGNGADAVDLLVSGAVGDAGGVRILTKAGAGVLALSNSGNNYTGGTTIVLGELRSGATDVLPNTGTIIVTDSTSTGNAVLNLNGFSDTIAALTLGGASGTTASVTTGAGTLTLGGTGTLTYTATANPNGATISGKLDLGGANHTFSVGDSSAAANDLTISAVISSTTAGGPIKTGAGTLVLSAANTYAGSTFHRVGTIKLGIDQALSTGKALTFQNRTGSTTATVDLAGFTQTIGTLQLSDSANQTGVGAQTQIIDSLGGGLLKLGGTVTYNTGAATFENGTTTISAALDLNTATTRTFSIADSPATTTETVISGAIQNSLGGGLTKSGAGVLVLSGASANTFTGPTIVSAGTLEAATAGALGSTSGITVNTGGTLLLSGASTDRINDSATVNLAGGKIAFSGNVTEGTSPGTGALTLSANSIIDFAGGDSSINFADSIGTWTGTTLSIWNWGGTWDAVNGGTAGGPDQLKFGIASGSLTSGQLDQISFYSGAGTGLLGTGIFKGSLGEVVPVPEPATWAGLGGLGGLLAWLERRRLRAVGTRVARVWSTLDANAARVRLLVLSGFVLMVITTIFFLS